MPTMRCAPPLLLIALAAIVPTNARAQQRPAPLRVVRVTPKGDAGPLSPISVTFDRPVAGSLDRTVDAAALLRVQPAVPGKIEWRDPMTIRLTPSVVLTPGTEYAVSVANTFRAIDGSALPEPYRFTFRARGPTLIGGSPAGKDEHPRHLAPNQRFELVYSAPVDLAKLSSAAYLEFAAACSGAQRIVHLTAAGQRRIRDKDDDPFREAGGWQRDRALDSLRRVVQLTPPAQARLPYGCSGELVVPSELDDQPSKNAERWPFDTYGALRITTLSCDDGNGKFCPTGPLTLKFSTPVRGAEVLKHVRMMPATKFTVSDTSSESDTWTLDAALKPHVAYAIVADTMMRDVFGQRLRGNPARAYRTTGYAPSIIYPFGRLLVERVGFRTLAVQHINVDTLVATIAPIPARLEASMLGRFAWGNPELWDTLGRGAEVRRLAVRSPMDKGMVTGVRLPVSDAARAGTPTLFAVKIAGRTGKSAIAGEQPTALVQVTDLGVHARIGAAEGVVWVTGVSDGRAKQGASVVLYDAKGRRLASATTDAQGLARLSGFSTPASANNEDEGEEGGGFEGYVSATLGDDRALTAINRYDPDLSPWRFNVSSAWGEDRLPIAGTVFTERGIYRPGERVYAKAIIRDGSLGALRVPAAGGGDSVKWLFHARDEGMLREVKTRLSSFGTADQSIELPAGAPVGEYTVEVQARRQGKWRSVSQTGYRVAEYRPPEFLVDLTAEQKTHLPGEPFAARVQARYLFGAPMGRAVVTWEARQTTVSPWEIEIPGLADWYVGETGAWWEWSETEHPDVFANHTDTLDVRGERTLNVKLPAPPKGRPARVTLEASITDINRQVVGARTTTLVHPAEFYVAAKPAGTTYFWQAGTPQTVNVVAVRPEGQKVAGVAIRGAIVRREWHQVRRERGGVSSLVGEWVSDTVARCTLTSAADPVPCTFTPTGGGEYTVMLSATDRSGRVAATSFERWTTGPGFVPWSDESQFKMDVIPDRTRYSVGDTATVMFASPFTDAEAWITVEREGLIDQRRMRLTSGSTTLKFPITEAYAPNAFVSIVVARGRTAKPGALDDGGRPTIRVGYAELRVTPEVKRLTLTLDPDKSEYRPADSARVQIHVRDARGQGARSEVTLWAVDEGVLALTGYTTPDPIDLLYKPRGLGMRLASNMTSVAPQIPEGEKGKREAGGGGGAAGADVLRSRFQTTAFFLGSVVTDAAGNAVASAKLPDNLTTFRVMAVAVTAGDRYGKGQSSMLVTRPLLARQALPRFTRPGDAFTAGAVINRRDGAAVGVTVKAQVTGSVTLRGQSEQKATLAALRGAEVRFPFQTTPGDTATFRFDVTDGKNADAVRVSIPLRPDHHPTARTVAGVLRDTATVDVPLPAGIDPDRSRVKVNFGMSPLATIRGIGESMHVYPYYCSEQVISAAVPIIALYRAQREGSDEALAADARRGPTNAQARSDIVRAVAMLSSRQRSDGGIGYWGSSDWTSPWLSAYAGLVLLDARDVGVPVDSMVLNRLASYLKQALHDTSTTVEASPLAHWYTRRAVRLADHVAAVDFLSRVRQPDVPAENELLRTAGLLALEDRARFAEVLARRGQTAPARRLMESMWSLVRVEGGRAVLPDSAPRDFYFESRMRPYARLLTATLALAPEHALIGPLVETLAQQGRAAAATWMWNTQDYASVVSALSALDRAHRAQGNRVVRVVAGAGRRTILSGTARGAIVDSAVALKGLLASASGGAQSLRLSLDAGPGEGVVYYYITVTEVPTTPPVSPDDRGVQIERWYERFEGGGRLATSVAEGDLVRVRLRITVPATRYFVVLDDALPAGLEAVDLSLRTASALPGPGVPRASEPSDHEENSDEPRWGYGRWDSGWWSPFDYREIRDDRVVYSATVLWPGTYTATYLARATTPGTFIKPPAYAEEMYNPGVNGRSDAGTFVVTPKGR